MSRDTPLLEIALPADTTAPALARHAVRTLDLPDLDTLETIVLLTSEVVANAVQHPAHRAEARVVLRAHRRGGGIRVEVLERRGPSRISPPAPGWELRHGSEKGPGWGLRFVERLSRRWGTIHDEAGTLVWFEVEMADGARSRPDAWV